QFKFWEDGTTEPGSYTDFTTDLATDYGVTSAQIVTSNILYVGKATVNGGTNGLEIDWLEIEGYGPDPADGTCDPFVEPFDTDSVSDWPDWSDILGSPYLNGGATRDVVEVTGGLGRQEFSWPDGGGFDSILARDLVGISSWRDE